MQCVCVCVFVCVCLCKHLRISVGNCALIPPEPQGQVLKPISHVHRGSTGLQALCLFVMTPGEVI